MSFGVCVPQMNHAVLLFKTFERLALEAWLTSRNQQLTICCGLCAPAVTYGFDDVQGVQTLFNGPGALSSKSGLPSRPNTIQ